MSILIKGLDMPKGCDETCPLKSAGWCCEGNNCPLVEINDGTVCSYGVPANAGQHTQRVEGVGERRG